MVFFNLQAHKVLLGQRVKVDGSSLKGSLPADQG